MFQPSAPLLRVVPHLYTATSFQPPALLEAPTPPSDWVSYNAIEPNGADSFEDFKASAAFKTAQGQFLERVAACEQFASQHFSAREAAKIRSGLDAFRTNLLLNDGATFFNAALPKLYGSGKRHFDHFCLRLAQEDIDLHQRKTALRELAAELHLCRSSGAAFRTASKALSRKPGGLHGEFHELLLQRINALLREVVKRGPNGEPLTGEALAKRERFLRGMEVHAVNRLRMELDLPGAELDDRYACEREVTPRLIQYAQQLLRAELHPTVLAQDLAERYLRQLRELLPPEARSPTAELTDSMGKIIEANTQMGATFGAVPLPHLLQFDEDTGETSWQNDVSLLANDLLKTLQEQGLVVRQEPGKLLSDYSHERYWDLLHLDWRLFLVSERKELHHEPALVPVQIHHALALLHRMPRLLPLHTLTDTLLSGGRPENLAALPAEWLEDEAQCQQHCSALGDERLKAWVESAGPLPTTHKRWLTSAMTQLNLHQSLTALMASDIETTARGWIELAGGFGLLRRLLASQPSADVVPLWTQTCRDCVPAAQVNDLLNLFGTDSYTSLVTLAMQSASRPVLTQVLMMALEAREAGVLSNAQLNMVLRTPIQQLMKEGRVEAFREYADQLVGAANGKWLSPSHIRGLLEGPHHGEGCRGAMQGGHAALVHAFHSAVHMQHEQGNLTTDMARSMAMGTPVGRDSCGWVAMDQEHPAALAAHLDEVLDSVLMGLIPRETLCDLLQCANKSGVPGLYRMLIDAEGGHPCVDAWIEAVTKAHRHFLLTQRDVTTLLHAHDVAGTPLLHHLLHQDDARESVIPWLDVLHRLHTANVLSDGDLVPLLESRLRLRQSTGATVLSETVTGTLPEGATRNTVELYGHAQRLNLVSGSGLVKLVRAEMPDAENAPLLVVAMDCGLVAGLSEYLDGLRLLAEEGQLDEASLLKLLDASNDKKVSALTLAMINQDLPAVETFLQATLALAEQGSLTGESWCRLMMPLREGRPIYELSSDASHDVLRLFDGAIQRAEQAGLLGGSRGQELSMLWEQFRMALPEVQASLAALSARAAQEALQPPPRLPRSEAVGTVETVETVETSAKGPGNRPAPPVAPRPALGVVQQALAQAAAHLAARPAHPAGTQAPDAPHVFPAPAARPDAAERPSVAAGRAAMARAAMAARPQPPVPVPAAAVAAAALPSAALPAASSSAASSPAAAVAAAALPPPPSAHVPLHQVAELPPLLQIPPRRGAAPPTLAPLPRGGEPPAAEPPPLLLRPRPAPRASLAPPPGPAARRAP